MNFLLISVGTRGDVEPFIAIAELLSKKGHQVTCLFPEQFRKMVEESSLPFESLGPEFLEMLETDAGKTIMGGGSGWKKFKAYVELARSQSEVSKKLAQRQFEVVASLNPDKIIHHSKAVYPVIWEVQNPNKTILISSVPYLHYVKGRTHLFFNSNYGEFLNKLTFKLADWGLVKNILASAKTLGSKVGKSQIKTVLKIHKIIYAISPQLFERPKDWKPNLQVLGHHERDITVNWFPSQELEEFLGKHKKPLFITFGSMVNAEPKKKTTQIINILKKHKIPAIINTAAGGLLEPDDFDSHLFCFIQNVPYKWILPKVHAMVHHGGSGTTHMALKYGVPAMIIPHIIDQFVWNKIASDLGVGPKGIKIGKITEQSLEPLLLDLFNNNTYQQKAQEISLKMQQENFSDLLYQQLTETISRK